MSNYNRIKILLSACFISFSIEAKIHEYETSLLKSRGGSGAAAALVEESSFLNPASTSLTGASTLYYQHDTQSINDTTNKNYPKQSSSGFVLGDSSNGYSLNLSYISQIEENDSRKGFGLTTSTAIGPQSFVGYSIRLNTDLNSLTQVSKKYYESVFGVTHIISQGTSVAIIAFDPFKSKADNTHAIIGINHELVAFVAISADLGLQYLDDQITKNYSAKGAIQIKVLDDFYLKFGIFNDKSRSEKGEGIGLSWMGPRFSLDFGLKNTRTDIAQIEKKSKDISFSIAFRGI
jgi:hypothetical protein